MLGLNQTAGVRVGGSVEDAIRQLQSWKKFLGETVPKRMQEQEEEQQAQPVANRIDQSKQYDLVVIGYGGAGASAALDAADAGKRVLLVDRFDGCGSTRRSGGVYYAGAGTRAQRDAGVVDDVENMFQYLKQENGGAVDDATIREFCQQSPATFDWLCTRVGIPFQNAQGQTVFYEKKVSYPPSSSTLYFSGNEAAHPFNQLAKPAARGNRAFGDYLTGNVFFLGLERAVESHKNIDVVFHCKASELKMNAKGECVGVTLRALAEDLHSTNVMLHEIGSSASFLDSSRKIDRQCAQYEQALFDRFASTETVTAKLGVVVSTGGYFFNPDWVTKHAPKYQGYMPLGNLGDDGSGIALCEQVGCALGQMDRCSAWKFTNPPFSFLRGVLVNAQGVRVGNEDTYGATFADFLVQRHGGKGWLVIDQDVWDEANEDCMNPDSGLQEDQRMQGLANLHKNRVTADSLPELANKLAAGELEQTILKYNADCKSGKDTVFGKLDKYLKPLTGTLYAIRLDMVGNKYWPTPCMSLGGVKVDGATGLAIRAKDNQPIKGLYCAGRAAVGICSNYYVSGLSLGDAIFSGRRAGRHAASQSPASKL